MTCNKETGDHVFRAMSFVRWLPCMCGEYEVITHVGHHVIRHTERPPLILHINVK